MIAGHCWSIAARSLDATNVECAHGRSLRGARPDRADHAQPTRARQRDHAPPRGGAGGVRASAPTSTRRCTCCCSAATGTGFCGGYDLVESAEGMGEGRATAADAAGGAARGSPLDPMVMATNHDPRGTWDPMVDYAMMSRNVRGVHDPVPLRQAGRVQGPRLLRRRRHRHGAVLGPARDRRGRQDRLPAGARVGLADDRAVGAPRRCPARQAAAVHRRLAVRRRGARVGPRDRGAAGRAAR